MIHSNQNCVPREDYDALMRYVNYANEANRRLATEIGALRKELRELRGEEKAA